jgi:hypothetical protein
VSLHESAINVWQIGVFSPSIRSQFDSAYEISRTRSRGC